MTSKQDARTTLLKIGMLLAYWNHALTAESWVFLNRIVFFTEF